MKPIALTTCRGRLRDSFDRARGKFRRQPFTDYSYHSDAFEQSSAHYLPTYARPLWNIAGDYLKREARHDFWSEAALFAFITVTAALPLINNAHALIELVRAITVH
jgi:hypothetical protein